MTIDQLIEALNKIKAERGGDVEVAVYQYAGGDDKLCDVSPRYDDSEGQVLLDTTYQKW